MVVHSKKIPRVNGTCPADPRRKYKRFHRKPIVKAFSWLQEIASKDRSLFYHWQRGQTPRLCLCTKT